VVYFKKLKRRYQGGVIIDTFGDLRQEKQEKDYTLRNTCFICGKFLISFLIKNINSIKYIRS
jgi:preprotein translocase subunit Sec63